MRRYFVSRVVDVPDPEFGTLRLPKIATRTWPDGTSLAHAYVAAGQWAISVVSHPTGFTVPTTDSEIDPFPDVSLDIKLSAIQKQTYDNLKAKLGARGIDTSAFNGLDAVRDLIRHIGRLVDSNFHEDRFGVAG